MKKRRTPARKGGSAKARKKGAMSRGSVVGLALLAAAVMALLAVLFFEYVAPVFFGPSAPVEKGVEGQARRPLPADQRDSLKSPVAPVRVAIVIDDFGYSIKRLRRLLTLDAEIAVAVLPHQRYSRLSAEEAHKRGWLVLLHLPMEPQNSTVNDPGKGALFTSMSGDELKGVIEKDLKSVPYVTGVNNHMGSKATADKHVMRTVLSVMARRNLFFLDSRTTPKSVAPQLMDLLGVRGGARSVFLDNTRDRDYIKARIDELVRTARLNGSAIAIGHPYKETIDVLLEVVPELKKNGVEVVRLSDLMKAGR